MKKQNLYILILVAILSLLAVAFFWINSLPSKDTKKDEITNLLSPLITNTDMISSLDIKNNTEKYTINVLKSDGELKYELDNEKGEKVSQSSLQMFMNELTNILPMEIVEENVNDLNKYGLEKEDFSLTVNFDDGTKKVLYLGNEAPLKIGYYLKMNDDNIIYLVTNQSAELFLNSKEFYLDNKE